MNLRYLAVIMLVLPFVFSCQKSSDDSADPTNTGNSKAWQITDNQVRINGKSFNVSATDMSITASTESAFLLLGGDQFNNIQNPGQRLTLYNVSNNIPFSKGLTITSSEFDQKIFSLQYNGLDSLGNLLPPQLADNKSFPFPQGKVVVTEMNYDSGSEFGFNSIEFDFDMIIVSGIGQGQGTMTQGTTTISSLIDGKLKLEYR